MAEQDRIKGLEPEASFVTSSGKTYLARHPDGRCLFLASDSLCELHRKHGMRSKPLACRVFPYAFSLRGPEIAVGVRFECPAVAANEGSPLRTNRKDLEKLATEIRETTEAFEEAPTWRGLEWGLVEDLVQMLVETVTQPGRPLGQRLLCVLRLFGVMRGADAEELSKPETLSRLRILKDAILKEEGGRKPAKLGRPETTRFYQLLAYYARRDEEDPECWTVGARAKRGWAFATTVLAGGALSRLGSEFPPISLKCLFEEKKLLADPLATEPAERFYRIKLETHQFYGPSHHDFPLDEGLDSLLMTYPVMCAFSRLFALGQGHEAITREDVTQAVRAVDHGFSKMEAFRTRHARSLVKQLSHETPFRQLCDGLSDRSDRSDRIRD